MVKFDEANTRLFKNIFVCRRCKRKTRAPTLKVAQGKVTCRNCHDEALRPKRKK